MTVLHITLDLKKKRPQVYTRNSEGEESIMGQKDEWWYKQSGVIPYRIHTDDSSKNSQLEVLLITSRKQKRWIIPKGIIDPDLAPPESAAKEAFEEAGIRGNISKQAIGSYTHNKWSGTCTVEVFLLEVTTTLDEWPEGHFRKRRWMGLDEAIEHIKEEQLKALFKTLPNKITKT